MGRTPPTLPTDLDVLVIAYAKEWTSDVEINGNVPGSNNAFLERLYFRGYLNCIGIFYKADKLGIALIESLAMPDRGLHEDQ